MAALDLRRRGYVPLYTPGSACPGCGRSHWHIGRQVAECAWCGTALPMVREKGGRS